MTETLADSKSPFLQHGAAQPVRWLPWSAQAFERARAEDKPVLLDIGAVWCHWCHVMDRESYENEQTAQLINDHFVAIKVDRDERPDVDIRYQRAVQSLTGQGGWPLTAFLTPEGDTFYGGTYFPPEDLYGRPSFRRVLSEVSRLWREERPRAQEAARSIQERLSSYAQAELQSGNIDGRLVTDTIEEFAQVFDFRYGGFGRAPKFPNAGGLQLLLDHDLDAGVGWSRRMVLETLQAMVRGGIYDQLGGGFHRYSVDARWLIPHFEKMSYDNGPLLEVCARAAAAYQQPEFARAARGIVQHYHDVADDLLQSGGFPASQDADYSADDDGDYWTWTAEEMRQVLHDEDLLQLAVQHYGVDDPASSMHLDPERHVLYRALDTEQLAQQLQTSSAQIEQKLETIRARLKQARDARPQPFVDRTVYTGWSSLVASGFLACARHLEMPEAAQDAVRALQRIERDAFAAEQGLAHRLGDAPRAEHLDDHAYFAQALLDAFEYTQERHYLEQALVVAQLVERNFLDVRTGAYRDRPLSATAITRNLAEPSFTIADSPVASGNGVMALTWLRLAATLADDSLRERGLRVLRAFGESAARLATAAATYVRAVSWATSPVTTVVVVSHPGQQADELWRAALRTYRPRTVLRRLRADETPDQGLPPEILAMLSGEAGRAYVCVGQHCLAPLRDAAALAQALQTQQS